MKIAFITDIHSYAFNDFSKDVVCEWNDERKRYVETENGDMVLNSRLFNILSGLADVRDYCVENDINLVLNGGDTFHKRSTIDVTTFNCTYRVLESYRQCGIRQVIISGNHDNAINADNSPSSIETFKTFADVATTPMLVQHIKDNEFVNILCLPWMKSKKNSLDLIDKGIDIFKGDGILLAHLGVSGASLGSGYVMSDDYQIGELKPNKWKYVLLGHYHKPQLLHDNVIYGGSPLQNDFGDEGDAHGFWVIDTQKRYDMELIPLHYPQFLTINSDNLKDYSKEQIENNYVRIQTTTKDVESVQKELEDVGEVRIEVEKEYTKNTRSELSVTMTHEEVIKTYVEEATVDEKMDKATLLSKGLDVLRKVGDV